MRIQKAPGFSNISQDVGGDESGSHGLAWASTIGPSRLSQAQLFYLGIPVDETQMAEAREALALGTVSHVISRKLVASTSADNLGEALPRRSRGICR